RTTSADSRAGAARVARAPSSRADPVATRADPVASNRVARSRAASAAMTVARAVSRVGPAAASRVLRAVSRADPAGPARADPVREGPAVAREGPAVASKVAPASRAGPARADLAVSRVAPASKAVPVVARADSTSSADRLTHHR